MSEFDKLKTQKNTIVERQHECSGCADGVPVRERFGKLWHIYEGESAYGRECTAKLQAHEESTGGLLPVARVGEEDVADAPSNQVSDLRPVSDLDQEERQKIADMLGVPVTQIHKLSIRPTGVQQPATEPDEEAKFQIWLATFPVIVESENSEYVQDMRDGWMARAALALRDVPQGQWIDVKERLPEENERVLIWMYEGRLDGFRERFGEICLGHWRPEGGNGNFDSQVSYWQPLPAAPVAARQVPVGPEARRGKSDGDLYEMRSV